MRINKIFLAMVLGCSLAFAQNSVNEDELLMKAIYYSKNDPKMAAENWKKLFELTNNEKYLMEYFYASLAYKDVKDVIKELKDVLSKKKNKELYELLGSLYTKEGNTDGVIEVMENISTNDKDAKYELAYLYATKGENDKALKIYKTLYEKEHNWRSLKGILSVLIKEGKVPEAKEMLWSALHKYKMPKDAYLVMAGILDLKQDNDKAIYIFKKLYEMTKNRDYIKQLIGLYLYKKDYKSVVSLLEKSGYDNNLLYELYLNEGRLADAYKLLYKLYNTTKKPKWLAEKAILTFEIGQKYKAVDDGLLKEMSRLFEEAFAKGAKSAMYYNYYGYTLIDYNKDVKKGIEYVKKALKLDSKNVYYLDSLAWGYYKLGICTKAQKIMEDINKLGKVTQKEILEHRDKIQRCQEK